MTHIQIGDTAPRIQYVGNAVQKAFAYPFAVFIADDLEIWLDQVLASTGFAIAGAGSSEGGTVTFTVAPAAGVLVTLRRRIDIKRTTDFQTDGVIRAKTLNDELDYQTAAIQQVAEDASRAVARSPTSASTADLTLPEPVAGRAVKWNSAGTGLENSAADADAVLTSASAQASAASASANAAHASELAAAAAKTAADADAATTTIDRAIVAADKAIVSSDKATVTADKAIVASDKTAAAASAAAAAASATAAAASELAAAAAKTAADADAATTTIDRAIVAADKAIVSSDKAIVASDKTAAAASAAAAYASELAAAASAAAASAVASGGVVKITASDTTSDYLSASLSAGANIALSVLNPGSSETLQISVSGLAAVATSGLYSDLTGKPSLGTTAALDVDTDTALTANSDSKIASQKAVKAHVAAEIAANTGPDLTAEIGGLWLALARVTVSTAPEQTGQSVVDEFDDPTGISSLGGGVIASGYLSNPGGLTQATPTGSTFGNMTGGGNLAAAFDGVTNQAFASSASYGGNLGYVGKAFSSATSISQVLVWVPNDGGGFGNTNTSCTVTIYGKNGIPASYSDGTALGNTGAFTDIGLNGTSKTITFSPATYTHFWAVVNESGASANRIAEVQYFYTAIPANITTVSNAYTATTAPSTVSMVVEYQDISAAAVVGTDITFDVSRDNGATWTAVTMSDFGSSPISGARVLKGSVAVSGQPSGTSIKYRVKTFNAKEQRVHGVWMTWR